MTTPNLHRGPPRDWRVPPVRPASTAQFWDKARANAGKPCDHPGCQKLRSGISPYCTAHRLLHADRGDITASLPTANQLIVIKKAVEIYLGTDPMFAKNVEIDLRSKERERSLPASSCMKPSDCHKGLPRVAKSTALLANWYHRKGRTYTDALLHAIAMEAFVSIYYDGAMKNRKRFLLTQTGAVLGHFNKQFTNARLHRTVTGAVHRHAGSMLRSDALEVYGRNFWDKAVKTVDGQDLTILQYTRMALQAAGLLNNPAAPQR